MDHRMGAFHVGEFKNSARHGRGTLTWGPKAQLTGHKYVGDFRDDKQNGQGRYTYADGSTYTGAFRDDVKSGKGTKIWGAETKRAGHVYVGMFENNKPNGKGSYSYANGTKYVGFFEDGVKTGRGTKTWGANTKLAGHKYVGEWRDNKQDGQGTYSFASGDIYVGDWSAGERTGEGTLTFSNQSKYVGGFLKGQKHGQGVFNYENGDIYTGMFQDDLFNGQGTFIGANRIFKEGLWKEGELAETVTTKTCVDVPSLCNANQLCGQSLTFASGKADWRTDNINYVAEAKRRGLSCGVAEAATIQVAEGSSAGVETEDNNSRQNANSVGSRAAIKGQLSSDKDIDFYSIEATTAGIISVDFELSIRSSVDYYTVSLHDMDGNILAAQSSGRSTSFSAGVTSAGRYYVSVSAHNTGYSIDYDSGEYALTVQVAED